MVNKESAMAIALRHLGDRYEGRLEIREDVLSALYWPWRRSAPVPTAWLVFVPDAHRRVVGAIRYVAISKTTGKIVFDGIVSE
jgi:hypothetical protein